MEEAWQADGAAKKRFEFYKAPAALLLALVFVLSLFIEAVVFNAKYFGFDEDEYKVVNISLPFHDQLKRQAVVLNDENKTMVLNDLDLPVRTVYVHAIGGPSAVVEATIAVRDITNEYSFRNAQKVIFNPAGEESSFIASMTPRGNTTGLRLTIDSRLGGYLIIDKITLNKPFDYSFSFLRFIVVFAVLAAACMTFRYKLYQIVYDPQKKSHKAAFWLSGVFCLFMASVSFYWLHPANTNSLVYNLVSGNSTPLGTPDKSLLLKYPETPQELFYADIYPQLLDAFLKGQFNLDIPYDAKLAQLKNPWDRSARDTLGANVQYERSIHDGKYYVYFGLTPLFMVYMPVYALTGEIPSAVLVSTILMYLSIAAFFLAMKSWLDTFKLRPNLLMLVLGSSALVSGAMTYYLQHCLLFYNYLVQCAVIWFCLFIFSITSAFRLYQNYQQGWQLKALSALAGLSIVLIVQARPMAILYVAAYCVPFLYYIFKEQGIQLNQKIKDFAPGVAIVVLGALFTMYYNYSRFGSIFQFGVDVQLTGTDQTHNFDNPSLHGFVSGLYYNLVEPFVISKTFPFITFNGAWFEDFGNYFYFSFRAGIFQIPLVMFFLLGFIVLNKKFNDGMELNYFNIQKSLFYSVFVLLFIVVFITTYVTSGQSIRYMVESIVALSFVSLLLIWQFVKYQSSALSRVWYIICTYGLIKTILIGIFVMSSNNDYMKDLNPDFFIAVSHLFSPWA